MLLRLLMPGFVAAAVLVLAALGLAAAQSRRRTTAGIALHRGRGRAWRTWRHTPRHAVRYVPRHEEATSGPVQLGQTVTGDLALIHADQRRDTLTNLEPIGAAA